uniref:DC1 domain-containing protein n=1 Tax=Fagus sylvatica TaxID=28930 RepID=A0A2N9GZ36_FAGSY
MEDLQHFCHDEHPLVFNKDDRRGLHCWGCGERVYGPSYCCKECRWYGAYLHHKSCAKLPLGLHHPLHPKHSLILFPKYNYASVKNYNKCEAYKEDGRWEYNYCCSSCDFNLHIKCANSPLSMESEVHDHPLTCFWKLVKFTCDLCGKEGHGAPYLCVPCHFWTHKSCASCLCRVKVIRHKHPLDLIHSLEVHQSDSRFCQIYVQKVDTNYGLYYCSECNFVAHLDCAMDKENREELKDEESTEQSVDSAAYEVKKHNVGKDGTKIATEIKHFSHEHDLKLIDEGQNNKICNGCVRAIHPPFYSCGKCSLLHKSCVELPRRKRHPLHQHSLTLLTKTLEMCNGCWQCYNGFNYSCTGCRFDLDVQCSLISDILTHEGHEHRLILSNTPYYQKCNGCDSKDKTYFVVPLVDLHWTSNVLHYHLLQGTNNMSIPSFFVILLKITLVNTTVISVKKERNPNHWFYYCADCSYPAHPKCILGKEPNVKSHI